MWPHRRDAGAHTSAIESRVRAEAHHETEHDIVVPAPAAGVTDPRPYRIVVGGAVAGLRPGSVSLHCVVQSACPVVVIPPQRRATGHGEPGVHADSVVSSG